MDSLHDHQGTADMTTALHSPRAATAAPLHRPAAAATADTTTRVDIVQPSANASVFTDDHDVIEAWARQASFASGFGGGLGEIDSAPASASASAPASATATPAATVWPLASLQAAKRVMHRLRAWLRELRASLRAQATARQLAELDDRQLRDIGISRSEILSAALESERAVAQYSARVHTQRVA